MQSTHNTISSQIALHLNVINITQPIHNKAFPFESGLFDTYLQFKLGVPRL